ncbi:MAG TPA: hypothetical protein DCS87_12045 [Rheinheimera sp.]|nr:hypothetical protein [Rheinheimera sp.]
MRYLKPIVAMCGWLTWHSVAAPAPFYFWQSQSTGKLICKQVSPGEGWRLFSGPYVDGGCRTPVPPTF